MGDETLNRKAAEAMGWELSECGDFWLRGKGSWIGVRGYHPASDLNQAFTLLEQSKSWSISQTFVNVQWKTGFPVVTAVIENNRVARAITIAFLKARGVEVEDGNQ